MRHNLEVSAKDLRIYKIKALSDDVLPAYSSKENLETLFAAKLELNKLNKYRVIGVLDLKKNENEEPSAAEIIEAPLLYLAHITNISIEQGKISLMFSGPDDINWSTSICLYSETAVTIKAS